MVCGYSKIPGVDFRSNYSPVVNDVICCVLLLAVVFFGLTSKLQTLRQKKLCGKLEEEILMECPPSMVGVGPDDVLALICASMGISKQHGSITRR